MTTVEQERSVDQAARHLNWRATSVGRSARVRNPARYARTDKPDRVPSHGPKIKLKIANVTPIMLPISSVLRPFVLPKLLIARFLISHTSFFIELVEKSVDRDMRVAAR